MAELIHTPGPWRIHEDGRTILSTQSHPIATLSDPGHREVLTERGAIVTGNDAPVIAAAPRMYLALKLFQAITEQGTAHTTDEEWLEAREALDDALDQVEGRE